MDPLQRLRDIALSDSGFVFDPLSGQTFSVNSTGKLVIEKLRQGLRREAILAELAGSFATDEGDDLLRDLNEFLLLLKEQGVLPREAEL